MNSPRNGAGAAGPGNIGTYVLPMRVYYQHTDAGGVVHHGRYLEFMEAARTELLQSLGFDLAELAARDNVLFIVFRLAVDYQRPARLNDRIEATAAVAAVRPARIVFAQSIRRGDEVLVSAEVQVACVDARTFRPVPVPDALKRTMGYENQE